MIDSGFLKAALYRPQEHRGQVPTLPQSVLTKTITIDAEHCERFNNLVNWSFNPASVIHPNYLQVLSLPMQLQMMVTQPFPFKLMGLVHLANDIRAHFLPAQNASLVLTTSFNGLIKHKRGWVFGILSEGFVNDTLAISARSYYLSRQSHLSQELINDEKRSGALVKSKSQQTATMPLHGSKGHRSEGFNLPDIEALDSNVDTRKDILFSSASGREYARVSGDFNPIHLSPWTAKMLGFKKAIAHGMYSKALCVSEVMKEEIIRSRVDLAETPIHLSAQFMQAIYLPAKTLLKVQKQNNRSLFTLVSKTRNREKEHLRSQFIVNP